MDALRRRLPSVLLVVLLCVCAISLVFAPAGAKSWALEVVPGLALVAWMVATRRTFPLSDLVYIGTFIHVLVLPFTLFFDAAAGAVARVSDTQVGLFDGKTWTHTPHRGGKLAIARDPIVCVAPGKTDVLLVKRATWEAHVVRVRRARDIYTFTEVATFASPVAREPHSTGSNATFDRGWFDEARFRVVVHFPEDASLNFALDLETLFEK